MGHSAPVLKGGNKVAPEQFVRPNADADLEEVRKEEQRKLLHKCSPCDVAIKTCLKGRMHSCKPQAEFGEGRWGGRIQLVAILQPRLHAHCMSCAGMDSTGCMGCMDNTGYMLAPHLLQSRSLCICVCALGSNELNA